MRLFAFLALFFICGCSIKTEPLYTSNKENINTKIQIISERNGQILRNYILNYIRDYPNNLDNCIINIILTREEEEALFQRAETANRLLLNYIAEVSVRDYKSYEIIWTGCINLSQTMNISRTAGDIMLSLYSEYESYNLKKLAKQIFETLNLKVGDKKCHK